MTGRLDQVSGALVAHGDYYGSLAATRCLGSRDVLIWFSEQNRLTTGASSKFVHQRVHSPSPADLSNYGDWLLEFGGSHNGLFLYPASDDMVFILASRREELSQYYRMYQPSLSAVMMLLDKSKLSIAASRVSIRMPQAFIAESEAELMAQVDGFSGPLLVKPRTQIGLLTKGKGLFCESTKSLPERVRHFVEKEKYRPEILSYDAAIQWPIVQAYHASAVSGMLSIAGFVSHDYSVELMLCSEKVFQRPRRLGVGIAFDAREIPPELSQKLVNLCRETGYFGIFEAEFIYDPNEGEFLLVDFNPRYYGQMAFEIARGLALPALVYYAAVGDHESFEREVNVARENMNRTTATVSRYSLGWLFNLMLFTQRIGRVMDHDEHRQWKMWFRDKRIQRFDAVFSREDRGPFMVDVLLFLWSVVRHPRDFYRKFFR